MEPDPDKRITDLGYEFLNIDESLLLSNYTHIAHCSIYSPNPYPTVQKYESKAYIMMHMRYDGRIGFPGGEVFEGSDVCAKMNNIVDGLNRELEEEVNLDSKYFVSKEDYCFTNFLKDEKRAFHFFTKEVSVEDFVKIEKNSLEAEDFGHEVLGPIRVPLFTFNDNFRGFPAFLSNHFAGCARSQLLNFLITYNLSSYDYIMQSLSHSKPQ